MFNLFIMLICLWIGVRVFTYGIWEWRKNNKIGGIAVFIIALLALSPSFIIFA